MYIICILTNAISATTKGRLPSLYVETTFTANEYREKLTSPRPHSSDTTEGILERYYGELLEEGEELLVVEVQGILRDTRACQAVEAMFNLSPSGDDEDMSNSMGFFFATLLNQASRLQHVLKKRVQQKQ